MDQQEKKNGVRLKQALIFLAKIALASSLIWILARFDGTWAERSWMPRAIGGTLSFLIPSIILSVIRFSMITIYNARHAHRAVRGNFVLGINRLTAVANAICAIIALMIIFGIRPLEFITSLTIVAMALAVTFRDYITNMISGLIIMFSDQISIGDRIKFGDHQGRIVDITLANLVIQDEEDDIVMVPNNMVFTSTFTNLSAYRSRLFTVRFELPLRLAIEVNELEKALLDSLVNHPNLEPSEPIELKVIEIGKDFVRYRIDLHAVSYSNKLHRRLENEILKEVLKFERRSSEASSEE